MTAAPYNLPVEQFTRMELPIFYTDDSDIPINLVGCSARMQIRTLTGQLLVDLSSDNGGIVLGGRGGTITIIISAEQTANPLLMGSSYDLILTSPSGAPTRLMAGKVLFSKGVTHG